MTLAAILAAHTRVLPHRDGEGVARCGVETVGTPHATPATPATPKKQTPELRTLKPSYTVQQFNLPARVRHRFADTCTRLQIDPEPILAQFDRWQYPAKDLLEMDGWPDSTVEAHCRLLLVEIESGLEP